MREEDYSNYTSRVHVADMCQAIHASILNPSPGKIYNIVNDDPAPREEVFEYAQKLVEEKLPGHGNQYIHTQSTESLVPEKPSRAEKRVSKRKNWESNYSILLTPLDCKASWSSSLPSHDIQTNQRNHLSFSQVEQSSRNYFILWIHSIWINFKLLRNQTLQKQGSTTESSSNYHQYSLLQPHLSPHSLPLHQTSHIHSHQKTHVTARFEP